MTFEKAVTMLTERELSALLDYQWDVYVEKYPRASGKPATTSRAMKWLLS